MTEKKSYTKPEVRRLGNIDDVQSAPEDPAFKDAATDLAMDKRPGTDRRAG